MTTNDTINGAAWQAIAAAGEDFALAQLQSNREIEVATTSGSAPASGLRGFPCDKRIARADVGPGAVYARCRSGESCLVTLATWTA